MKRRPWVLVIALIIGIIIFGGYFTWKITKADQKIKVVLLNKMRPFLADESDIEKVSISLNSISLRGVKLAPKDQDFYVNIEEVRLGYNLFNILKYRFALHKLTHQIVLVHPIFTIKKFKLASEDFSDNGKYLNYKEVVKELSRVKRVGVSDAEFFLQDSLGNRKRFARSLNGWLYSKSADSTLITLSGNLFGVKGRNNLKLDSQVNLLSGEYKYVHIYIQESDLTSSDVPFFLPEYLRVNSGEVKGEFNLTAEGEKSGFFTLNKGSFSFKNFGIFFNDVNIKTVLNDSSIVINGSVGDFCNTALDISGIAENLVDFNVDLQAKCSGIDFKTFSKSMFPEKDIPVQGRGDFFLQVKGPINNPEIRGNLLSSNFKTVGIDFPDFNMNMSMKNKKLRFTGISKDNNQLDLMTKGTIDISDSIMISDLNAKIQGNFLHLFPDEIRKRLNSSRGEFDFWLRGGLKDIRGEGNSRITFINKNLDRDEYILNFNYKDEKLDFKAATSHSNFKASGEIQSPFRNNITWRLKVNRTEYPIYFLLSDTYRSAVDSLLITTDISGDNVSWAGEIRGRKLGEKDTLETFVLFPSYQKRRSKKEVTCEGYFRNEEYNKLDLELKADFSADQVRINSFHFADDLFISGKYSFTGDKDVAGLIRLQDFNLDILHSLLPGTIPFKGQLNGGLEIKGRRDSLEVYSALSLNKGVFHDIGNINGDLEIQIKDEKVKLCTISLEKDERDWFRGSIESTGQDSLKGKLYSQWEKGGELFQALAGFDFIKGSGEAEFIIGGTNESPHVNVEATFKAGSINNVSFNDLYFEVVDTLWEKYDISKGNLRILKGRCSKDDTLKGVFWGFIPHGDERDSDISLLLEGNILSVLPELNNNFKNTKSKGELFLRVGGNEGEWFIGSGRLEINEGKLSYLYPFDDMSNLQIKAEVKKGESFVALNECKGKMNKGNFEIRNQPVSSEESIVPFILDNYRLNLGKLLIKTNSKGIILHIPGLMEKAEDCWIDFKGFDPHDDFFTIAGPVENPLFRGTLVLRDYRFTYPFLKLRKKGDGYNIFQKVFWDVNLYPKEDVHYIKEIKTPLGNFDINLKLQDEYGGLRLYGCIEKDNLQIWGNLASVEGIIDVLGYYFRPERISFDYPQGAKEPIISGRAYTTVVDSLGMRSTVWLAINTAEQNNGFSSAEKPWHNAQFRFYTNDPDVIRTNTEVLSLLEGGDQDLKGRAYEALGLQVENYILGPIIKPVEREIRKNFGLDLFHFSYMFGRNFFKPGSMDQRFMDANNLIQRTKLTVGKYLSPNLFLTYSGQIQKGLLVYPDYGLGFKHSLSLEYMINPDLFLEMEYTYNSLLLSDWQVDKRIWIRHVFPF